MILKLSGAYCAVRSVFRIISIDTLKSIYFACFHSIMKLEYFLGVIHLTVKGYLLYKRKLLELWLVPTQEICVEAYLRN
jgi:hypothetical protein